MKTNGAFINILYKASSNKYPCARKNFKFFNNPVNINIKDKEIYLNELPIYNLSKILKFDEYYKIFFENGKTILTYDFCVKISKYDSSRKSTDIFSYLKDISKIVSIKTDDGVALLNKEYEKINYIDKNSALYMYLNPNEKSCTNNINLNNLIFPFGANESQFKAVRNAMSNQISIIEGPPGTGKTQTILNIISNVVKLGKNVAIVSNNNSATDNVYEKLEKYKVEYICAKLGSKKNKEKFISSQIEKYPEFEETLNNKFQIEGEVNKLNNELMEVFSLQNMIAKQKTELSEIELQHKYFQEQDGKNISQNLKIKSLKRLSSKKVLRLKVEVEDLQYRKENINFWFKIKSYFIYGIGNREFYKMPLEKIIKCYDKLFFITKEFELKEKIAENIKKLSMLGDNRKIDLLKEKSLQLFEEYLREKYSSNNNNKRKIFELKDLAYNSDEFIKEYPVILSTTHSIKNCLNFNYKFDYIIMDESSQVDLVTGALAMSVAKNVVIVGDEKQLPNVISREDKEKVEKIANNYDLPNNYNYNENSFLSSVGKTLKYAPRTMLREHYRCHPKIIGFCNKKFYNNELIIMTEDNKENDVLKAYITVKGNHARDHYNQRQIDVIKEEILPEISKKIEKNEIGIISPYRNQTDKMQETFDNIQIDTVHKFQGREKEGIIITTVDNIITDFVDNPNMLNVAITRARRYLRLVVSDNEKNTNTNIDDLLKYINYNNFEVVQSEVKSIYDLLYKDNFNERLSYLKDKKRISEYDSEVLTYNLIKEVLEENNFQNLGIAMHISLKNLLKGMEKLNSNEIQFANNTWTHIDIIIFNEMNKEIFIAVEVDGYIYHKEGTEQEKRDRLKDSILAKYNIPLIRFSTIGSGEKEKLKNAIESVFRKNQSISSSL